MAKQNENRSRRVEELSATEPSSSDPSSVLQQKKKRRLTTNERARLKYEKILAERREQAEKRRVEKERKQKALENYLSTKKKMNRALLKKNKRGQPNLNAQIEVLLEKIQKRCSE